MEEDYTAWSTRSSSSSLAVRVARRDFAGSIVEGNGLLESMVNMAVVARRDREPVKEEVAIEQVRRDGEPVKSR